MSERHRALPAWMAKKEEKVKKEPLKSRRKQKTARAAFYCMNETELVEAAASCLTSGACGNVALLTGQQVEDKAEDTAVKKRENPATSKTRKEESSDCSDALDTTYVSEHDLDLDMTELETLPYTKSPEGQRSGQEQGHSCLAKAGLEAEESEEHSQMAAEAAEEEEDALRLVREIFFTR